jgi:hypothetical protein
MPATFTPSDHSTTVQMVDGREMSYDSYLQESIGRFMPAKVTRRSKASTEVSQSYMFWLSSSPGKRCELYCRR